MKISIISFVLLLFSAASLVLNAKQSPSSHFYLSQVQKDYKLLDQSALSKINFEQSLFLYLETSPTLFALAKTFSSLKHNCEVLLKQNNKTFDCIKLLQIEKWLQVKPPTEQIEIDKSINEICKNWVDDLKNISQLEDQLIQLEHLALNITQKENVICWNELQERKKDMIYLFVR